MKNFIAKTLYALLILLFLGIIGLVASPILPIKNGFEIKIVKSGSMEPAIKTGGIVVIRPSTNYGVGDVVTFGEDTPTKFPTTHRIVSVVGGEGSEILYQTKGDANEESDPSLTPSSSVIGKVVFSIPYAGYIIDFARQPIGFILLIALPAFLVILNEIMDITKEIKKFRHRDSGEDKKNITNSKIGRIWGRTYAMDDVLRPIYLGAEIKGRREVGRAAFFSLFAIILAGAILGRSGNTLSYFSDQEFSPGNSLAASSFTISANTDQQEFDLSNEAEANVLATIIPTPSGFPNEYVITVEKTGGTDPMCQALLLNSTSTTPFAYAGQMLTFASPPTVYSGDWNFVIALDPNIDLADVDTCTLDLVFKAKTWLEDKGVHAGYSDEARVPLTFNFHEKSQVTIESFILTNSITTATTTEDVVDESEEQATTTEELLIEEEVATSTEDLLIIEEEELIEKEEVNEEVEEEVKEQELEEEVEVKVEIIEPPEEAL